MDLWHSDLNPVEGMPEIVDELKKRNYRVFLLSNTSLRFFSFYKKVKMFEKFDGFIVSAKERLMKPDQAIYQCLCKRYSLIPQECLFIDDLQKNVDGAIRAGFAGHCFAGSGDLKMFLKQAGIL
jgi:putative hydrolase of the HAD superfamily